MTAKTNQSQIFQGGVKWEKEEESITCKRVSVSAFPESQWNIREVFLAERPTGIIKVQMILREEIHVINHQTCIIFVLYNCRMVNIFLNTEYVLSVLSLY